MNKTYFEAFKYKAWANAEMLSYGERQLHLLSLADKTFFLRILNHTAVVDSLFISRISGTTELYAADNTIETPTLSELRERMSKNDAWLINFAETVTFSELGRCISFQFTDGDRGRLSVDEILLHLLTHGSNHRGMAARVLASNNLERPKDTFTRFLHQLEPLRRESTESPITKLEQ
jgi:uncharacterized damage-inducible protein DinB